MRSDVVEMEMKLESESVGWNIAQVAIMPRIDLAFHLMPTPLCHYLVFLSRSKTRNALLLRLAFADSETAA